MITRLGLGGAERVAETIAIGMKAHGVESTILPVAGVRDEAMAQAMRRDLEIHGVEITPGASATSTRRASIEGASILARTVDVWQPDVVHLHTEIPEFTYALATYRSSRLRQVATIRTVHNTILWGGWSLAGRFAERRLDDAAVAAVSHAAGDAFVEWRDRVGRPTKPPIVIYNGITDVDPGHRPAPRSVPVLCFAGRFELQKGIDVMLDALPRIARPYKVLVFGSGSLQPMVVAAAESMPRRLVLADPVPDLRSRFSEFDAILMPSRFEGLSNLAVEALFAGLPVLATDAPGLREALPDWYPGRCDADDPIAFARMVDDFLAAPEAWMEPVARAQTWARERFSAATMVDRYQALYSGAIGAPSAVA